MNDFRPIAAWLDLDGAKELAELALNLRWSWNHASDELWKQLDVEIWKTTRNPWVILQTVSRNKIETSLSNLQFRSLLDELIRKTRQADSSNAWFQEKHSSSSLTTAAYFSMEFMLSEALPIYSGGLGNVAGDQMKAASDLGIPVVGIGLLYGQGYFRQDFDSEGNQQALYPVNDPGQLPIRPLRHPNGEWLRLSIRMPGSMVWVRCWEVSVGRNKLYLLDANDFANSAAHRGITSQLYGGDAEMRLKQEVILGIGGWRLLKALGIEPEVCHLNEGHAAFAVLERAASYMTANKVCFELAMFVTRAGNIFTTHTAVAAGFDRFDPNLIRKYLSHYAKHDLAISVDALLGMGREDAANQLEAFNMAYLALRGSGRINGVSKLHGEVSRRIFQPLFPRWPQDEVPIGCVTNGIHVPTWDSAASDELWTGACGQQRWHDDRPKGDSIRSLKDEQLWQMRVAGRKALIAFTRERYTQQLASQGLSSPKGCVLLDDDALTVGFARRFATYKRPNLLLRDPERLIRLLTNSSHPVQLILAGKAHPQDRQGQALIRQWSDFIRRPEVLGRVVFLSDYDMLLAQELVRGVDLWINTPRRPWEACGTSGMKILVNGGLNLSELDGWWAEAYSPEVGWAIGDGAEHSDEDAWDASEAEALYSLLEQEVVPEFYAVSPTFGAATPQPSRWLGRIRESMARLTPEYSAGRAIREYVESHYIPAAMAYKNRSASNSQLGRTLLAWQQNIEEQWGTFRFGNLTTQSSAGSTFLTIEIYPGQLTPEDIQVELYANANSQCKQVRLGEGHVDDARNSAGMLTCSFKLSSGCPTNDLTARVVPKKAGVSLPLECNHILWQH